MASDAPRMAFTLVKENRLYLVLEKLVIQRRRSCLAVRLPHRATSRQEQTRRDEHVRPFYLAHDTSRNFLVERRSLCLSVCLSRRRYVSCKLARCPVSATSRCVRGPRYAPPALCSGRERGSCRRRDRQVRCVPKCN